MARPNIRRHAEARVGDSEVGPAEIRDAVENGEMFLHYQPLVSLARRTVVGMEALARWNHPALGCLGPDSFIPCAERGNEIKALGAWVIREACAQAARWQQQASVEGSFFVSVNVSPRQLTPDLVSVVAGALDETGCRGGSLVIEITEQTAMADAERTRRILADLEELGVGAVVDDFGTGYSSLAYLRRLPLRAIKVDRAFIDGLGRQPEDSAIVAAVVSMAHALGRWVLAEGVETPCQLEHLRVLGCDMAQGFYFGRPLPPDEAGAVLTGAASGTWRPVGWTSSDDSWVAAEHVPVVLVVDDNSDIRFLVRTALSAGGLRVHEAASGADALGLVSSLRPDSVVVDMDMPGMSGLEIIDRLRANGDSTVAILMLTGHASPVVRARAYALGADDFVVKPIAPRELVDRVFRVLRDKGAICE
ncbi:MAG: EAL domain-containing protein [Acidimicrobiia bacterium]|nr:EAL domain-containing protein [Acidimicrobiia bacterium]